MLIRREPVEEVRPLRHDAYEVLGCHWSGDDVVGEDADLTRGWEELSRDLSNQRGLACPVRPEDADHLARVGHESNILVRPGPALVALVERTNFERWRLRWLHCILRNPFGTMHLGLWQQLLMFLYL